MMSKNQKTTPVAASAPTIILTGGGSGGHITPILSLVHELKSQAPNCRLVYVGLRGEPVTAIREEISKLAEVRLVSSGKFRRFHGGNLFFKAFDIKSWLLNIRDFFKVIAGIWQSLKIIRQVKPDLVFSKGGYVVVPVGIAAHWKKIKIITHDSDAKPGLANRFIGRWARWHATGLPAEYYDYPKDQTHFVGIPVNPKLKPVDKKLQTQYKNELNLSDGPVLLVGGAGLGARTLNGLTTACAADLLEKNPKLQILHLTGQKHLIDVKNTYAANLSHEQVGRLKVEGFVTDFYRYSGAADLIVTRPGATAMAEFAVQAKACLVIPADWLPNGHQTANAKVLKSAEAAEQLSNDTSPENYQATILELLNDAKRRQELAGNLSKLAKPKAASDLAKLILGETN